MQALFTREQQSFLQSKLWWVACNITPFLIRSAVQQNVILLTISDLKRLWGTRIDERRLMKDKQIYAKTLQVSSAKELINLFEGILSNTEQKAVYKFIKKTSGDLSFEIQKEIEVYPLTWKFQLIELDCEIVQMVCKNIVNPLIHTLNAQQKRIEIMRRKMKLLEQNLLKRMTETEKVYYKSALNQDQQDLKLLVTSSKQQQFIADIRMQSRSKFFFQLSLSDPKQTKIVEKASKQKQVNTKIEKRVGGFNTKLDAEQIINELQMKKEEQRDKKKKKRNIDFI